MDLLLLPVALNPGEAPGAFIWLNNGASKFTLLPAPAGSPRVFDVADLNADGRPDLLGLSTAGEAQQALNHGSKNYHWQILRPRARVATGDQRINSFGIGGEMETTLRPAGAEASELPHPNFISAWESKAALGRHRSLAQWHAKR